MPENKVLEKLNAVSTAKRLANMVRVKDKISHCLFLTLAPRNYMIQTLAKEKKYIN